MTTVAELVAELPVLTRLPSASTTLITSALVVNPTLTDDGS